MNTPSANALVASASLNIIRRRRRSRKKKHGGSRPGRSANIERDHVAAYERFKKMYFGERPMYTDDQFRRRFRMSKSLFNTILDAVGRHDVYFTWRKDCTGKYGAHPALKVTSALRLLAYGCSEGSLDEGLWIGESTVHESLDKFTSAVIAIYGPCHLRLPNENYISKMLEINALRGFPGVIGSIDCMRLQWKNCPSSWCGAFQGASKKATVVLEAVATADLHIWHAFIGMPGINNDLNVLDASPLIAEYVDANAPRFSYEKNGSPNDFFYYLADGIYPEWKCFVKSITAPANDKQQKFASCQESVRKDFERAFGVLQARFAIVARPAQFGR